MKGLLTMHLDIHSSLAYEVNLLLRHLRKLLKIIVLALVRERVVPRAVVEMGQDDCAPCSTSAMSDCRYIHEVLVTYPYDNLLREPPWRSGAGKSHVSEDSSIVASSVHLPPCHVSSRTSHREL